MSSVHGCGGGGGGGSRPLGSSQRGGSGSHALGTSRRGTSGQFKAKGGSGEKTPPGLAKKGGMPPGLAKKMQDGWDEQSGGGTNLIGDALAAVFGNKDLSQLLGNVFSSVPGQTVNGTKGKVPALPDLSQSKTGQALDLNKTYVNQYSPTGADKIAGYNGAELCGPALLASYAKAKGITLGTNSDAEMVQKLAGMAGSTPDGTSGNGLIHALNEMGVPTTANPGADLNWINNQLAAGRNVFANGDFYEVPKYQDTAKSAGHYITVNSFDGQNYGVTDPAHPDVTTMTPQQLLNFIASHPEGGFTIAAG